MTTASVADTGLSVSRVRYWRPALTLGLPALALVTVGAANGGFSPTSFGWTAIAFAWVVVIAVTVSTPSWGPLDLVWAAGTLALCLFTMLSALWASDVGAAVDGGLRTLEYLVAVVAAVLILRRRYVELWLGGLALGAAGLCVYSLATRLLPGRFGSADASASYRLFIPIGYWNALGIFAALAALLGWGIATVGTNRVLRVAVAVGLVVLMPTLYFTFSRGASASLVVGVVAALLLSTERLRLIFGLAVFGALPALAVLLASREHALTQSSSTLAAATHAGHHLIPIFFVLAVLQSAVAIVYVLLEPRVTIPLAARRAFVVALCLAAVIAVAGGLVAYGSPTTIARHAYDNFTGAPTRETSLNNRLFSFSNNGRIVLWHSAWHEFEAHPIVGGGSQGFRRWWLAHRDSNYFVEDAHNLYVQTLGELGVIGAGMLALVLGLPLVAAWRARRHPLAAPAAGAYLAYLAHSIVDWDWQVPAVTLFALFVGAALVAAARTDGRTAVSRPPARVSLGAVAAVAGVLAFVGLIGNIALARSENAFTYGTARTALAEAKKAHRWAPWSAEAIRDIGQAQIVSGNKRAGLARLRQAADKDPGDWLTWFDLAAATAGRERSLALAKARALNPADDTLTLLKPAP